MRPILPAHTFLSALVLTPFLTGCWMVGPNYKRPQAIISPIFKEAPNPPPGWTVAQPEMAEVDKGPWWRIYGDPTLDGLEDQVNITNQNVKQYEAQYRKARAMIDSVRAQLFPTLNGNFSFSRNAQGGQSRSASAGSFVNYSHTTTVNTWSTSPSASWTIDIWGKIRRQVEQQVDLTQASAADLANARLSYQAQLATNYFNMRYQDSLRRLYARNVSYFREALRIVQNQAEAGVAEPSALLQARYQLQQTIAQETQAGVARAQYEHAIAVLMGKAPAEVTIPEADLPPGLPAVPAAVPSTLLQRRPDIASAERKLAGFNAAIGAAIAAYYPQFTLSAQYGYSGDPLDELIRAASRFWSLGAAASETIFSGGARRAAVRSAKADYDAAVANYRQTVLTALQNVEDNFSNLRILEQQYGEQEAAVASAKEAVRVSMNAFMAGTEIYTTVITSQQNALNYEVQALGVRQSQWTSHVALITALGGGWDAASLPKRQSLTSNNPFIDGYFRKAKE
ncbi:Secretion system type I outer membrane efflux pump lipoprotein NodT [Acetobacteraceae bacterium EV16G]|uniref:Secretion system type I outer membrane efflux pump lipoprotein NodT n=1 Tax=Sorlinia euscelidii TaxID=3081148 RepID=A0ABU7TYJ0_9PROT